MLIDHVPGLLRFPELWIERHGVDLTTLPTYDPPTSLRRLDSIFLTSASNVPATMPRNRPATTGYERLDQADLSDEESDEDFMARSFASLQNPAAPRYGNSSQPRPHSGMTSPRALAGSSSGATRPGGGKSRSQRRSRSNSGVDVKAINARLERWADEIAAKFKRGKKDGRHGDDEEGRLEIHYSVFQAPEGVRPVTEQNLGRAQQGIMSKDEFEVIVESVRLAMEQGVQPLMITQGSSGSYFARNPEGKVVGVFKPKDEEPYAAGNPKWNKWIHRNLFPCCFGRAWYVFPGSLVLSRIANHGQPHSQSFLCQRSSGIHTGLPITNKYGAVH